MSSLALLRDPRALALACAVAGLAGCDAGANHLRPADLRAPDGVLADAALQAVEEDRVDRDLYALMEALGSERSDVRARAALALASLQAPESADVLERALEDESAAVRRDAAFALGRIGSPSSVEDVSAALLSESDASARRQMIDALGRMPSEAAADALLALEVRAGEEAIRTGALARLAGLYVLAHEGVRDHLFDRIASEDADVRVAAAHFFGQAPGTRLWAPRAVFVRPVLDSYAFDDPAAAPLLAGLSRLHDFLDGTRLRTWASEGTDWRNRAAAMAGHDPLTVGGMALLEGLDDPSPAVSAAAAETLGMDALPAMLDSAVDAWVLVNRDRLTSVAPLLKQAAEGQRGESVLAWIDGIPPGAESEWSIGLEALAYLAGEEVLDRLVVAVDDPSERVSRAAAEGLLGRWEVSRAAQETHDVFFRVFAGLADHERPWVAAAARTALGGVELSQRAAAQGVDTTPVAVPPLAVPAAAVDATLDWDYLAELGQAPELILDTDGGTIRIELATELAPLSVQTVTRLASQGAYDGVPFHRVIASFMAQTGDFVTRDGLGDPGFSIRTEVTPIPFARGTIGMANLGEHDTENSQFFLVRTDQMHLDRDYTAFGIVVEGMDVVDAIGRGDVIRTARVVSER